MCIQGDLDRFLLLEKPFLVYGNSAAKKKLKKGLEEQKAPFYSNAQFEYE